MFARVTSGSTWHRGRMQRTLLINADDIGIYPEAVQPAVETITDGIAASGSVMTVSSGSDLALSVLAAQPDVPVGVHLTLTRDFPCWRWAPLTGGTSIQRDGLLAPIEQREALLAQARTDHIVTEFRAQIEKALAAGLRPTHLDWHCLADGGRDDIFDATLDLAEEYEIGIRAWTSHGRSRVHASGRVPQDHPFLDSFAAPTNGKIPYLLDQIRDLPQGLTEWAMHPAGHNSDDPGALVRTSDYEALISSLLRTALRDEQVNVIGHRSDAASGQDG